MSLVNLAHVCSHLQNASLARLGLTSIPYTKWHLSLALLLQKQGFLSQVKLGGPSPPASCFGQGPRDNHSSSNYPHGSAGRNPFSPESALALMIRKGYSRKTLLEQGFDSEAAEFAERHGRRSLEELWESGWAGKLVNFIKETRAYIEALAEERELAIERNLKRDRAPMEATLGATPKERRERVEQTLLTQLPVAKAETFLKHLATPTRELHTVIFDISDLEAIAGRQAYKSEKEIRRDGITIEAVGLRIDNQHITFPKEEFQDPEMLEAEGVVTQTNRASRRLWLGMKYYESKPVLSKASMVSKPTKRIWLSNTELAKVVRGSRAGEVKPMAQIGEIMAVSTDKGIMEARECVERRIGGMVLCRVW